LCVCMCVCVRACVRACVRVCVCVCVFPPERGVLGPLGLPMPAPPAGGCACVYVWGEQECIMREVSLCTCHNEIRFILVVQVVALMPAHRIKFLQHPGTYTNTHSQARTTRIGTHTHTYTHTRDPDAVRPPNY